MDFRLLGRVEVWDGSRPVALGGPKQKAVLAALLLRHGEVVSTDVLMDDVWGGQVSAGTAKTLQVYIWQLRRALEPGRLPGSPPRVLVTQTPGYALQIEAEQLDAERFEHLARSGRHALEGGEPARALGLFDDALGLWRGAALADFTYEAFAEPEIARLEELRLAATEDRIDAELALSGHHHAVAELESLVARHPLRERLRRQLALAMYRSDRQADALAVCRDARSMLADELGIDPSQPLQELERSILNQDPSLAPPESPKAGPRRQVTLGGTVRLPDTVQARESGVLSFLIADIRGYTAFTQSCGDAAAAELAARFARIAREGAEAHGGEVPELRGDEALAVFPSPRQALRAAVELQRTFADECMLRPGLPLHVGMGLDAGEAVPVEGGLRGGPLNLAARLCSRAGVGEIVISQSVFLLARPAAGIAFEELGEVAFKGITEPVPVFRAVVDPARKPGDPPLRNAEPSECPPALVSQVPAIGRDRDARRLGWAWRGVRRGGRAIVLITGPAGAGKTQLMGAGAMTAAEDGARVDYVDLGLPGSYLTKALVELVAGGPTYLAVDRVEQASISDVDAIERIVHAQPVLPMLVVVAIDAERASGDVVRAVHRLVNDDAVIRLGALDLDDMRRIGELYVGGQADRIPADLLEATGGLPQRVHEAVADWAHTETAHRLDGYATETASGRNDLRRAEADLAGSIIDLQVVRERAQVFGGAVGVPTTAPYKGLARFDVEDAEWFFGRERLVAEMVSRLAGASLLGVVGPSGSGKSSAVRAGLVATLTSGVLPGAERRIVGVMRPGEHPLRSLDRAVWAALPVAQRERLEGEEGLLRSIPDALHDNQRLMLVVDQFEEVFTLCAGEEERAAFVDTLVDAAATDGRLTTVIAVRADFYGRCASYPSLAGLLAANHVLVGSMSPEEYRQVIEQPAFRAGVRIEPALVDALVSQVLGEAGALPLLSTALRELWEHRSGSTITSRALATTGGVQGAVARLAENAYADLGDDQRALARRVFLRLAGPGEGGAVVKRRVPLTEFDSEHDEAAASLLDTLARGRLVTVDESSVEIIHEALLREWPRYQDWLDEDRQGRVVQTHLAIAAREWNEHGRDHADLYRGARLSAASDWASRHHAELNPVEREFLAESRAQHQAQVRRLRALLAGAVALLMVAAIAAGIALVQRSSAQQAATSADAQRLGAQAVVTPALDRGLLLAREAVNLQSSRATQRDLWTTLLRAPAALYVIHLPQPFSSADLALSPDGRTLVVADDAGRVTFYNARSHRRIGTMVPDEFGPKQGVSAVAFSRDGRVLAVGGAETVAFVDPHTRRPVGRTIRLPDSFGIVRLRFSPDDRMLAVGYAAKGGYTVRVIDTRTGRPSPPVDVSPGGSSVDSIDALEFAPDGAEMILNDWNTGRVVVLDSSTLRALRAYPIPGATSIAVSPNGTTLAVGKDDGSVNLMSLRSGRLLLLGRHAPLGGIWSMAFTPDGRSLVTTSADHTTIVWDVRSGTAEDVLTGQSDVVVEQALSPDGGTLYTGSVDGTVVAWDIGGRRGFRRTLVESPAYPADIYSHPQPTAVAVSPDGRLLALSPTRNIVRLYDTRTLRPVGPPFRGFRELDEPSAGGAEDLAFSPDGTMLAAGGGAGSSVVVWNVITRKLIDRFTPPPKPEPHGDGLAFSPDGRTLANGDGGYGAILWNLRTGRGIKLPQGDRRYVLSLAWNRTGTRLVTVDGGDPAGNPSHAELWDISRHPAHRLATWNAENAQGWATSVAFSPTVNIVATGASGIISLRDASTGRPLQTLPMPNGYNGVLEFSPHGKNLAVLARDGAEVWDISSGTEIGTGLPGASPQAQTPGGPGNLRYTPDNHLVMVSPNGLVTIWNVHPAAWNVAACRIAARQLTRQEWARFVTTQPYARVCP